MRVLTFCRCKTGKVAAFPSHEATELRIGFEVLALNFVFLSEVEFRSVLELSIEPLSLYANFPFFIGFRKALEFLSSLFLNVLADLLTLGSKSSVMGISGSGSKIAE